MILNTQSKPVEKFGTSGESPFTIKASSQAFKILANNLYSNKIGAVVRELICNAYDSHQEAKNDAPFIIHSPNELEPWFGVQDFGTGISHEFMMGDSLRFPEGGYTSVFTSTKNNSNDSIGGLGLGRLAAFSYNDSYSVISIYAGIKRNYTVFLDEKGSPRISLMGSEETKEYPGFTVTCPVRSEDFYSFRREIQKFIDDSEVNCIWEERTKSFRPPPSLEGKGWKKYHGMAQNKVRMGLCVYPIDIIDHVLEKANLVLDFPIGSLDIAPSREALSYSDETRRKIVERLDLVMDELKAPFQILVDQQETLWEAQEVINENKTDSYYPIRIKDCNFTYKGKPFFRFAVVQEGKEIFLSSRNTRKVNEAIYKIFPKRNGHYLIDDLPKCRSKRIASLLKTATDRIIFFNPNDPVLQTIDKPGGIPLLSSVEYEKSSRKPSIKKANPKIMELISGEWRDANEYPLGNDTFYISCPLKELRVSRLRIVHLSQDMGLLGLKVRIFWVSPESSHRYSGRKELFSSVPQIIKKSLESIEYESFNFNPSFYQSLNNIVSPPLLKEICEDIKNHEIPEWNIRCLFDRYGVTPPKISRISEKVKRFLRKNPLLALCNESEYSLDKHKDLIKKYIK